MLYINLNPYFIFCALIAHKLHQSLVFNFEIQVQNQFFIIVIIWFSEIALKKKELKIIFSFLFRKECISRVSIYLNLVYRKSI